jgi:hypothetical protein
LASGSPHAITAVYGGNSTYGGNTSGTLYQIITNPPSLLPPTNSGSTITNGLVAWYPLARDVNDYSGNGSNATSFGTITYTNGVLNTANTALNFDGTTTYLMVTNESSRVPSNLSMSGWIKLKDFVVNYGCLGFRAPGDTPGAFYINTLSSGFFEARFRNGSGTAFTSGSISATANVWTFVSLTYDGSTLTFYTNGVAAQSLSGTGNLGSSTLSFYVGGTGGTPPADLPNFPMADVRLYNRALSATEIGTLYNNGAAGVPVLPRPVIGFHRIGS